MFQYKNVVRNLNDNFRIKVNEMLLLRWLYIIVPKGSSTYLAYRINKNNSEYIRTNITLYPCKLAFFDKSLTGKARVTFTHQSSQITPQIEPFRQKTIKLHIQRPKIDTINNSEKSILLIHSLDLKIFDFE